MMPRVSNRWSWIRRIFFVAGGFAAGVALISAPEDSFDRGVWAQERADAKAATTEMKPMAFEVVSIRRNTSGGAQKFGPTPDGYRMTNLFLVMPILTAYVPQTGGVALYPDDQQVGFPDWVINDAYDIDAKVAEADLANWKDPAKQPAMLRAMLQAMLADRLKLIVHRSSKEAPIYLLVVAKNGPKFKETNSDELHPGGFKLQEVCR